MRLSWISVIASASLALAMPSDFGIADVFGVGRQYSGHDDAMHWVVWAGDVSANQADCNTVRVLGHSKNTDICSGQGFDLGPHKFAFGGCDFDVESRPQTLAGGEHLGYTCGNVLSGPPLMCSNQRAIILTSICKNRW